MTKLIVVIRLLGSSEHELRELLLGKLGAIRQIVRGSYSKRERYPAVLHVQVVLLGTKGSTTLLNRLRKKGVPFSLKEVERQSSGDATRVMNFDVKRDGLRFEL